jgi:hypothetical protein
VLNVRVLTPDIPVCNDAQHRLSSVKQLFQNDKNAFFDGVAKLLMSRNSYNSQCCKDGSGNNKYL